MRTQINPTQQQRFVYMLIWTLVITSNTIRNPVLSRKLILQRNSPKISNPIVLFCDQIETNSTFYKDNYNSSDSPIKVQIFGYPPNEGPSPSPPKNESKQVKSPFLNSFEEGTVNFHSGNGNDNDDEAFTFVPQTLQRRKSRKPTKKFWNKSLSLSRHWREFETILRRISLRSFSAINGTLAGDIGFDPLGVSDSEDRLLRMREIELKHSRIAMVAALGWPLSELFRDSLFQQLNEIFSTLFSDPSIIYRPLFGPSTVIFGHSTPAYTQQIPAHVPTIASGEMLWSADSGGFLFLLSAFEYYAFLNRRKLIRRRKEPGDFGFDPLNLYEIRGSSPSARKLMREREIWNGRLAMLATLWYYILERKWGLPIVDLTPQLFRPLLWESFIDCLTNKNI